MPSNASRWLVLGLGNDILRDDRIGLAVVQELSKMIDPRVTVREASVGGMALLESLLGFDRVLIVDAVQTGKELPGTIQLLELDKSLTPLHSLRSAHDADLPTSLELAKSLGFDVPKRIDVLSIEVKDAITFDERMTEEVKKALPRAVDVARKFLEKSLES